MLGWLALFFLLADGEPAAKIVCAAAGEQQADLVYQAAALCVELSRGNTDDEGADLGGSRAYRAGAQCLADLCVVKEDRITVPGSPGAMIIRVPASKNTSEGKNIHVLICDELHEWTEEKHEKVYTVLTNGFGARRQPLVLQITTAGDDKETIAGKQYDRGKMLQAGQLDDPRYHFKWFEPAEDADWTDMESTLQANPSFDVTVREPFFADMLTKKAEAHLPALLPQSVGHGREAMDAPRAVRGMPARAARPRRRRCGRARLRRQLHQRQHLRVGRAPQ